MTMSVRLPPLLETRLEQEARRLGLTKSEFVIDAVERMLGFKNPAKLLKTVRKSAGMGDRNASSQVSARMKAKLRAKLPD
jgi:predicted DNA-binding protein